MRSDAMERIGKYEVHSKIGEGGMGVVYKGFDPFFEREVAIKTVSAELSRDGYFRDRFFREARSTGKLNHPNVITVFDLGEEEGRPYLVMEYLHGTDLKSEIASLRQRSLEQKTRIMIEICAGLAYAHKMGITHRDIKPGNIFIMASGQVKILDFGLARLVSSESMTTKGAMMGTPFYMAPEQWGNKKVDHRSDIFAAGAVFYELLTHRKAFDGDTYESIFHKVFHENPDPIDGVNPALPAELSRIISRMIAKEADDRYQQMEDAIRDLEGFNALLEERKRTLQAEATKIMKQLEQLLREHKELLELGPAGPEDATMINMSLLSPPEGVENTPIWYSPQDYLGVFDVSQQVNRNYALLSGLVERRKRALDLLREVAVLRAAGQLEQALAILSDILADDPGHIRAGNLKKELSDQLEEAKSRELGAMKAEELFQNAATKFAAGDNSGCMRLLDKVLEFEPANRAALELREGVQKIIRGRADAALVVARNALLTGSLGRAREQIEIARTLQPDTTGVADLMVEIERAEARRLERTPTVPPLEEARKAASAPASPLGPISDAAVRDESVNLLERVRQELGKRIDAEEKKREQVSALIASARDAIGRKQFAQAGQTLDEILKLEADRSDVLEMRRQTLAQLDSEKVRVEGDREKQAGIDLVRQKRFEEGLAALRHAAELLGEDSGVARAILEAEQGLREGMPREPTDPGRFLRNAATPPVPAPAPAPVQAGRTELPLHRRVALVLVVAAALVLVTVLVGLPQLQQWQRGREHAGALNAFTLALRGKLYGNAREALLRAQSTDASDPKVAEGWSIFNKTFSPEFADDFLGGLEFWRAPQTWRAESGKLRVKGAGVGVVRDKYYEDFEANFNLSFVNQKGAVWIVRAGPERSTYYLFQLTGPKGNPANSFAVFRDQEKIYGPFPAPANLGQEEDQFSITVKASGNVITSAIELVSSPTPEPLVLGTINDAAYSSGAVGFATKDDEEFFVRGFKLIPARKAQ
jgi:serine/threonine protein kinase